MDKSSKIYIVGHWVRVGWIITRYLQKQGYQNLILRSSAELGLGAEFTSMPTLAER